LLSDCLKLFQINFHCSIFLLILLLNLATLHCGEGGGGPEEASGVLRVRVGAHIEVQSPILIPYLLEHTNFRSPKANWKLRRRYKLLPLLVIETVKEGDYNTTEILIRR
jgi:hypothetical protein